MLLLIEVVLAIRSERRRQKSIPKFKRNPSRFSTLFALSHCLNYTNSCSCVTAALSILGSAYTPCTSLRPMGRRTKGQSNIQADTCGRVRPLQWEHCSDAWSRTLLIKSVTIETKPLRYGGECSHTASSVTYDDPYARGKRVMPSLSAYQCNNVKIAKGLRS